MNYRIGLALLALLLGSIGAYQGAHYAVHAGVLYGDMLVNPSQAVVVYNASAWRIPGTNYTFVKGAVVVGQAVGLNATQLTCSPGAASGVVVVENPTLLAGHAEAVQVNGRTIYIVRGQAAGCIYFANGRIFAVK